MILCDYGCGQEVKHTFKNGKKCCSNNVSKCPTIKKIIGNSHKGMVISEKHREAVRKAKTGKKDSKETRRRKSEARKGPKNPIYGKKRSKETRRKISKARKGIQPYNKYTIKYLKEKYHFFSTIEEMRYNPNKPNEKEIQVHCKNHKCENSKEMGGWFTPAPDQIYMRKNALENTGVDNSYFYCSDKCKQTCPLYRSKGADPYKEDQLYTIHELQIWADQVKKRDNYICQVCGSDENIHAHHIKPKKLEPFFALDPDYGITMCETCHYEYGHKDECSFDNIKRQCKKED